MAILWFEVPLCASLGALYRYVSVYIASSRGRAENYIPGRDPATGYASALLLADGH